MTDKQQIRRQLKELNAEMRKIVEWFVSDRTEPTPSNVKPGHLARWRRQAAQGNDLSDRKLEMYHRYLAMDAEYRELEEELKN